MKKYTITTDGLRKLTLEIFVLGGQDTGCVVDGDYLSAEHYVSERESIPIPSPAFLTTLRQRTTDPSTRVSIVDGDSTKDIDLDELMGELNLPTVKHARKLIDQPHLPHMEEVAICVIAAKCSDLESAQQAAEGIYGATSNYVVHDLNRVALAAMLYTHHQLGISRETIIRRVHKRRLAMERSSP